MAEKNGNVKWWQLWSVVGVLLTSGITLTLWGATQVIGVDDRSVRRDKEMQDCMGTFMTSLTSDVRANTVRLEMLLERMK
ncbi:MAG: hypothetical protein PHU71_04925 [Candidatus Gracilibacteria bacterium]|nr:hypothetical protein [Candidatus Gracilibacteria bacterium]